jgi:hypothetical protein
MSVRIEFLHRNYGQLPCPSENYFLDGVWGKGQLQPIWGDACPSPNQQALFAVPHAPGYYNAWDHRGTVVHVVSAPASTLVLIGDCNAIRVWCRADQALRTLDQWPRVRDGKVPSPAHSRLEVILPYQQVTVVGVLEGPPYRVPVRCLICGMETYPDQRCPCSRFHPPSPGKCGRCRSALVQTIQGQVFCPPCRKAEEIARLAQPVQYRSYCDYCGGYGPLFSVDEDKGSYCQSCCKAGGNSRNYRPIYY